MSHFARLLVVVIVALAPDAASAQMSLPGYAPPTFEGATLIAAPAPDLARALEVAEGYWKARGLSLRCPQGLWLYAAPLLPDDDEAAALAVRGGCTIWYLTPYLAPHLAPLPDGAAGYAQTRRELCALSVHEVGHLVGLPHEDARTWPIMAPRDLPVPSECEDAWPLPPTAAPVASPPPSPAIAPPPPPRVLAPARLSLRRLRRESLSALREFGMRRARPFACRLTGERRGTCRARIGRRACRGRVYVSVGRDRVLITEVAVSCRPRRPQVREHGAHAAMLVAADGGRQLDEDLPHVALDRAFGQPQPPRDAPVRQALGHQREHLALAGREL